MKKIFLLFCLIPQLAFASQAQELKALVDEFTYSMTVEWDQKDKAFAQEQETALKLGIDRLIQEGLTRDELAATLPESIREEIVNRVDLNSPEAIAEFLKQNQSYQKGASWVDEEVIGGIVFGLLGLWMVVALAVYGARCDATDPAKRHSSCDN